MILTRRWFCSILAGVLVAGVVCARAQFPRATITLEAGGEPTDFMFRTEQRALVFLPDSRRLVTSDWRQPAEPVFDPELFYLRLWDAHTGRPIATLLEGPAADVRAWSPDGSLIAATTGDHTYVWNGADGKLLWKTVLTCPSCFFAGDSLHGLSLDNPEIIDLETGATVRCLDEELWTGCRRQRGIRPNGVHWIKRPVQVVDLAQGKVLLAIDPETKTHWEGMSVDGRFFWYTDDDGALLVFHVPDGTQRRCHEGYRSPFLAFAPDGRIVAVHCEPDQSETLLGRLQKWGAPVRPPFSWVAVFDARTDRELFVRQGAVFGVFSPDGRTLAVMREDNVVELWDWPIAQPWMHMLIGAIVTMALAYGCLSWRVWGGTRRSFAARAENETMASSATKPA